MKQHITLEQLKECNIPKLRHLVNDDIFDDMIVKYFNSDTEHKGIYYLVEMTKMMTIGKMIEIIANKEYYFCIEEVGITIFDESQDEYVSFDNEELTDALWEAVKFVLEENDE